MGRVVIIFRISRLIRKYNFAWKEGLPSEEALFTRAASFWAFDFVLLPSDRNFLRCVVLINYLWVRVVEKEASLCDRGRDLTPTGGHIIRRVLPLVCGFVCPFGTEGGRSPTEVPKGQWRDPQTRSASDSPTRCAAALTGHRRLHDGDHL